MGDNGQILDHLFETNQIDLARSALFDMPPAPMPRDLDLNRVEGMMLGLAIGDALGCTSEGQLPSDRRARYGEIRDYLPNRYAGNEPVGLPSDDTQLAFWTLEQMIEDEGFDPDRVATRFCRDWIFGIGSTVKRFIGNYKSGGKPWYQCGIKSAGNGALMRIAPMVIPHLQSGTTDLWVDTALSAMLTHNDSASTAACLSFVNMLWQLLTLDRPPEAGWWLQTYIETAKDLEVNDTYRPRGGAFGEYQGTVWRFVEEAVGEAYQKNLSTLDACNSWYSGAYLLETMPSVIYILMQHGSDPEEAIVRAVNDTKDNDTIGAIVGAAVGALYGKRGLPSRWISGLSGRTTDRDDGRIYELLDASKGLWWHRANGGALEKIARLFAEYFANWSIELPEEAIATRNRGKIRKAGWIVQYLFGREADREYLDFYASHRMTNDRHVRMWEDGQVESLESYQEMLVYKSEKPGDKERAEREYREHNQRVGEILKRKGFR